MSNLSNVVLIRLADDFENDIDHPREKVPPLSLLSAGTVLKKAGYCVRIMDTEVGAWNSDRVVSEVVGTRPDAVVLQVRPNHIRASLQLASRIKKQAGSLVVFVGPYPTALPKSVLSADSSVDLCIRGEIDHSLLMVLDAWGTNEIGTIPGVCLRANNDILIGEMCEEDDLDALPFPDLTMVDYPRYEKQKAGHRRRGRELWGFMVTSRGCPYACDFCSPTMRHSYGLRFRAHSPRYVVEAIEKHHRDLGISSFSFEDDVFTYDPERIRMICELLVKKDIGVHWIANTRADLVDPETLAVMYRAGCRWISVGVESGSEDILKRTGKSETVERILKGVNDIHSAGIGSILNFIVGWPDETVNDLEKTFDLLTELSPMIAQCHFFTPYPGSPFHDAHTDIVSKMLSLHHYNGMKINISNIPTDELLSRCRAFYRKYYFSVPYLRRYMHYRGVGLFKLSELKLFIVFLKHVFKNEKSPPASVSEKKTS